MNFEMSPLVREAAGEWRAATSSRFLAAIRDGELPDEALDRWLTQDRIFVDELYRFQAVVLSRSPAKARGPILDGLVGLGAELEWFDGLADRRGLGPAEPHPTCARFTDFLLHSAHTEPFPVLAQILFAIEVVYLAAWSALAEADRPPGIHGELIEHWSNPEFAEYVARLGALVEEHPADDDAGFCRVLRLERDFWRMTWEA